MSATCARASVHAPRANPARRGVSARRAVRSRARVATAAAAATTDRDVAVVTGGAKGIGAACCELLAEQGWAVVVNHRASSADAAAALVEKIRASGGHALAHEADVGVEADVVAMFDAAAAYGTVKGLVNNAGILMGAKGSKSVADAAAPSTAGRLEEVTSLLVNKGGFDPRRIFVEQHAGLEGSTLWNVYATRAEGYDVASSYDGA